jgi:DNA (cytosine-5)-methyltransferase 1
MPQQPRHDLACLSLFSGGGGLDIGFERAGFEHVACYELLQSVAACLTANRPDWAVRAGDSGDVRGQDWAQFRGVDVMFGGPPCQPYSQAGEQNGKADSRDMVPAYVNAIQTARPRSFLLENVATLLNPMFAAHLTAEIVRPLATTYQLRMFTLDATAFGVPQVRRRAFIVGFADETSAARFNIPAPTHRVPGGLYEPGVLLRLDNRTELPACTGTREALGLEDTGVDGPAPTLRSGLTGKRFTTSIVSGQASLKRWAALQIWPNGVSRTREAAQLFPSPNGHFRLSVPDCALLQGFPEEWEFPRQVYLALGIIGNSVCPPVAFKLAKAIRDTLVR